MEMILIALEYLLVQTRQDEWDLPCKQRARHKTASAAGLEILLFIWLYPRLVQKKKTVSERGIFPLIFAYQL